MSEKTFRVVAEDGAWRVYTAEKPEGGEEYVFTVPRAVLMHPECEGHQCDWRGGPIHATDCPLYRAPP